MQKKVFNTQLSQYWIVILKDDIILGPLSKQQYFEKRNELSVPNDLKLNYSTLGFFVNGGRKDVEYFNLDSTTIDIKNLKGNK